MKQNLHWLVYFLLVAALLTANIILGILNIRQKRKLRQLAEDSNPIPNNMEDARINKVEAKKVSKIRAHEFVESVTAPIHETVEIRQDKTEEENEAFLEEFLNVIEQHYHDSTLKPESISDMMGISVNRLFRRVKALTASSPIEILKTYRLKKGKVMLSQLNKSSTEISYLVGFSSPQYFTRCFRIKYGVTPRDYQNQRRQTLAESLSNMAPGASDAF